MQEWCACGASIKARRKDVLAWRERHDCVKTDPEPDRQGAHAQVEHAGPRLFEHGEHSDSHDFPVVYARMGFVPNEPWRVE